MSEKKSEQAKVMEEIEKCYQLIGVWIVMKGEIMCGRITARYSKSRASVIVALHLFGAASKGEALFGYQRMTGWGYDRTATGIAEILKENAERLKTDFGIELSLPEWNVLNSWEKDINNSGYKVIRVI